ncbi:hypothetical protein NBRC10512_000229 [Rhodotorula toruloides]|uniref:RHTO0S28e00606g1_1 n=1 Tax=Rhodotorula toruloides TaxID=5286 RepID=A0A061BHU7_RHOTO|nr:RHTO0S28e00606g1_1 [Rhodotorula toruloides]
MFSAHRDDRQVEAPPSPPAVDRLSKLPMELLQKIFDDAYATDKPTEPLSRTLLPLFDRCVWRDVKVVGDKRLVAFCATFQTRPSVGRHCRTLKVEHLRSPAVVSQASLETVFANVPILVTLVIHGDWDTLLEVLMPSGRQAALPFSATIRHYSCICKTQRTDPYNPAYLACITSMTGLTALQLVLEHTEQGSAVSPPLPSNGSVKVAPLNVLSISVLRESDLDSLRLLLRSVPSVKKLVVAHSDEPSRLEKLIQALAAPDRLEHLVLHAFAVARRALPAELKQLTHLKQFTFHGDFSQLGRDSFDILRALPLERIELGRKSDISSVELIALLTGETRLPSLKRLHLDNLEGVIGGSIATESDIDEDGADRGWIMPRWTRSFRKMDRHGLINAGVKITGSFLRASDTEDAWNDALDTFADNENELFWLAMEANDGDEVAAWEAVYSGRMF